MSEEFEIGKYDDASWHYEGDFPEDLPTAAAATHIGMFAAWAVLAGLASPELLEDIGEDIERLETRNATPGEFLVEFLDGKLDESDLSDEGNGFAAHYYGDDDLLYLADYEKTLCGDLPSLYHVPDSWETFDRLAPILTARLADWRAERG